MRNLSLKKTGKKTTPLSPESEDPQTTDKLSFSGKNKQAIPRE